MTPSIASRRGDGVSAGSVGEGGAGDCLREKVGYRSFIDGVGDGVAREGGAL